MISMQLIIARKLNFIQKKTLLFSVVHRCSFVVILLLKQYMDSYSFLRYNEDNNIIGKSLIFINKIDACGSL